MMAGMIAEVRTIITKKGDPMAFVQLEDLAGQCEVVVFPRPMQSTRRSWKPDSVVLVKGKAQTREGPTSLLADSIQNYVDQARAIASEDDNKYQTSLLEHAPTVNGVTVNGEPSNGTPHDRANGGMDGLVTASEGETNMNGTLSEEDMLPSGEENPFRNGPPDWAAEDVPAEPLVVEPLPETPAPPAAKTEAESTHEAPQAKPIPAADESLPVKSTDKAQPERGQPVPNGKNRAQPNGNGAARQLTIVFRRSGDIDRDMFRLKEIYETVRDPRGHDHFIIQFDSRGQPVKLAFPDDPCTVSERLTNDLVRHFRVEVHVEE